MAFAVAALPAVAQQQAQINVGLGLEMKMRLADADFKAASAEANTAALQKAFNDTLWNDLDQAGIFDLVSKSFYPTNVPGSPQELCSAAGCPALSAWANAPVNATMLVLGNLGVSGTQLTVLGWVLDAKNPSAPPILGKDYREQPTEENARLIAHRFADAIIARLGGGLNGIAESKIYFIHADRAGGAKELWVMDYDGSNPRQLTHHNSIALSPSVSPDGTRVAYTSFAHNKPDIAMFSVDLGRDVAFPRFAGTNSAPSWSPDGTKLAFSSSMPGDPEIYVTDASGAAPRRLTAYKGPDTQPVWNPKTGAQIIWVSGRTGLPQLFEMQTDGTNPQRITEGGYAVSPSWAPNAQFIAFSWDRRYGPGAPGAPDIYLMDLANQKWIQLTHNGGRNDYPTWSPDGRHIAFQSQRGRCEQIWSMLANGDKPQQITHAGCNSQPSWSH